MSIIDNVKIAVAVHTYGHIEPDAYRNHITVFSQWCKDFPIAFMQLDGAKVAQARNIFVNDAKRIGCTHILFIDADHIIDYSLLPVLLGNQDASVVSGLVTRRSGKGPQVGFIKADEDLSYTVTLPTTGYSYPVDACAFGCTLIDMRVFGLIEKPYFKDVIRENKAGKLYQLRSDMNFCRELREKGVSIKIDTRAIVGHIGRAPVEYPEHKTFQMATYEKAAKLVGDSVLDLGCGFGMNLAYYIQPVCSDITGIDKPTVIEYCSYKYPSIKWIAADLEKDNHFGSFKTVICADVLEHLSNPDKLLATIEGCLGDDGIAVISTPDVSTIGESVRTNPDHKQSWDKDGFLAFLNTKLEVVESSLHPEIVDYQSIVAVCKKK